MNKTPNDREFTEEDERRMRERAAMRAREREEKQKSEREKKERQKKTFGKMSLAIRIILIVVVVISLLFIAANVFGNVTFSNVIDSVKDSFTNIEPGEGYPLEVGTGTVKDLTMIGDTLVTVRNDDVSVLNNTAKKTSMYLHSYSKPMTSVANGRMLVCDRITGRYMIVNRTSSLFTAELESEVYACTIAENGCYAFSLETESASSIVSVFDSKFTKLFDFKCVDEYIIGLSFSPNGKNVALIGIGSKDAYLYSRLYVINIKDQTVTSTVDFDGESLNNVFYSDNKTIIVVSENSYTIVTDGQNKEKVNFGYNTISRFCADSSGNFAVVLSKYGSIDSGAIALLDSKGKELFSLDIDCKIESMDYDGKTVCIVDSDNVVRTYNKKGKLLGQTKLDAAAQDITVGGSHCYALCYGSIVQLDIKTKL